MNEEKTSIKKKSTGKVLDYIISGTIFLSFLLCPLISTNLVVQGMVFEKMILFYFLVLLGVVAWVTKGVIQGELSLKRTPLDWPILALVSSFTISTILSVNQKDSLIGSYGSSVKGLMAVIVFVLFYYLIVNNINIKRIKLYFWTFITSASLVAVYSLLQLNGIFVLPFESTKSIGFNPIGSSSGLTMFLIVSLPVLVVAAAQITEIFPKLNKTAAIVIKSLIGIIILSIFWVLSFLNGFTFWPAAIVGIVIVLMFFMSKIISITTNNLIIPLSVFLLTIIFLVLGNFNLTNIELPAEVSLSKGSSWDIAKESLKANPIFGSGPSTFYYDFSKFKGVDFNLSSLWNVRFDNASGILFELLATVGVVGTLIFIIIVLIVLSICFLALIKNKTKDLYSIFLALFASYVVIIIYSMLFSLNGTFLLISVLLSIFTVSVAITLYPERFKVLTLSFRSSPKYALALAAVFLSVSAGVIVLFTMGLKMYIADIYVKEALTSETTEEVITGLNKAIALFPYQDEYYFSLANNYMKLANDEVAGNKDQVKIETALSLAIEAGKAGVNVAPNKAENIESLALIYENASFYTRGALEWAEDLYEKLAELDPDNPTSALRIALINMSRANAEEDVEEKKYYINEAIKKYDEAIEKKSDLSSAYYGKAIAYEKLENNDDAIEELKEAVILTSTNTDYRFELGRLYFNRGVSQPNLSQNASQEIAEQELDTEGEIQDDLSVETNQSASGSVVRNDDLNMAEQIFISIYQLNPNHANALYSLALLYQKIDETDNAKIVVVELLKLIEDEETQEAIKQQFSGLY